MPLLRLLGPAPAHHHDPSVADEREALAYWRRREAALPWHRRAARAEGREMAMRSRRRLLSAHLARRGLSHSGLLAPVVTAMALPRRAQARRLISLALRTGLGRRLRLMAATVAVAAVASM